MDSIRFDSLTRHLGRFQRRRAVLKALVASVPVLATVSAYLPEEVGAACVALTKRCKKNGETLRCCGGAVCRQKKCRCKGSDTVCDGKCKDLLSDPENCGACGSRCPTGKCVHGACTCDPFNNTCPNEIDGQCGCSAIGEAAEFEAICTDRNSACDLDRICETHEDCPDGSACLIGCSDSQPRKRCSKPCIPV
jgi:hypothetical protein